MSRRVFESMSGDGKRFYSRVFNTVLLNSFAVRIGLFDTLFCETDDPQVMTRWNEQLPLIVRELEIRRQQ
jgi:hypothetical protein